ncbi:MAG: SH3 domain-containing protein [Solidesulfovibrio sp. DCME]|uniref:SH3 domain-containing protein n=1 Tax=Solidesulfovibrio sp. DCME TaxID=3447380 RepID=UPI003D124C93
MTRRFSCLALLVAVLAALPGPAVAQPICPPGYFWSAGACRPLPPPPPPRPAYPPPVVVAPPYDPNLKQVARRFVTLRTCPGDGCPPVTTLSRGTPVRVQAYEGPFVLVRVPGSPLEGWVPLRQLTP